MLGTYTVSFFGHRQVDDYAVIEEKLEDLLRELPLSDANVVLLVGRNGMFDQLVSSSIRYAKRAGDKDNWYHTLVLPYATAEYRNNMESFHRYYDDVLIFPDGRTHYKAAIQKRNRQMVDQSDLVVFYLEHTDGGAYQTYQYAVKKGKKIVTLHS